MKKLFFTIIDGKNEIDITGHSWIPNPLIEIDPYVVINCEDSGFRTCVKLDIIKAREMAQAILEWCDSEEELTGYDKLWEWFGLSRASWLTMPRILMHAMPDEWQRKMANLLREWDATWNSSNMPNPSVTARLGNKFTKWPKWLLNYRHPNQDEISKLRRRCENI